MTAAAPFETLVDCGKRALSFCWADVLMQGSAAWKVAITGDTNHSAL